MSTAEKLPIRGPSIGPSQWHDFPNQKPGVVHWDSSRRDYLRMGAFVGCRRAPRQRSLKQQ